MESATVESSCMESTEGMATTEMSSAETTAEEVVSTIIRAVVTSLLADLVLPLFFADEHFFGGNGETRKHGGRSRPNQPGKKPWGSVGISSITALAIRSTQVHQDLMVSPA
jgi:hypothetical protein